MKDLLFEPIRIGRLELANRICMPAMHLNMAADQQVTDQLVRFYAERARGGAGLIAVGYATVDEMSGSRTNLGAHDDAFIPGLARLAAAIRDAGARASVQLNHAGRYNFSFFLDGRQPVAPSAVASRMTRETPRELTADEIRGIIESFARAALRVKKAGYDAVEVLSGTGYLISQFLSEVTNKRADEYGGSFENRMRFGLDVMRAIKRETGADFPLVVRINGNEFMPGGLGRKELVQYAKRLVEVGVDALCVNVAWHEAKVPQIVAGVPRGVFAYLSRGIREAVSVPVIASHRINDPDLAREMIGDGMCDMVAMGRALIADPFLPEKARTGREREILHCVACGQGCFDNLFLLKPVECLCNPRAGRERETEVTKTAAPRKIMVVGGGPAGMSAAAAAAELGHEVTLYERSDRLGGQLLLAGAPPGREEFLQLARDLQAQLAARGVRIVLNCAVDARLLEAEKPEAVVLATGAEPVKPAIPGADLPHVVQAWDVLLGAARTGKRVVIVGGGAVGLETALLLADKGTLSGDALKFLLVNRAESPEDLYELASRGTKEITLLEMVDRVGGDIGRSTRWPMLQDAQRSGIRMMTAAKALEITGTGIRVEGGAGTMEIPADTIVLAVGVRPRQTLKGILEGKGIPFRMVGDALSPAKAFDAIHQGFAAGRKV
ncbi:MAG: FAD-dependent oxidoreductase [bacterium]